MSNVCEDHVFSKVFKTHSKTVFNYIFYKFGNEEKAHDAVQEAFVKLWQNCAKVSPEKAKSYVYTIANNLYLNVIKAEKVRLKHADSLVKDRTNESPEFLMEEKNTRKIGQCPKCFARKPKNYFLLNRIDGKNMRKLQKWKE